MLSYEDCVKILGNRTSKKLGNNTYLVPLHGEFPSVQEFGIRLHNTHVVRITPTTHVLTTGGWQTSTTKDRLNKYGPVRIFQRNGSWWWVDPASKLSSVFKDGLTIHTQPQGV